MKEQGKYTDHIPEASANFINRSLNADGVGEDIRSRAAKHPQASRTVRAWEKDEQILRLAASGATFPNCGEDRQKRSKCKTSILGKSSQLMEPITPDDTRRVFHRPSICAAQARASWPEKGVAVC